jgi:prophage antirepressor-like protein
MLTVKDYQVDIHKLSTGAELHVLRRPDEDLKVPALQVCRISDCFKRKNGEKEKYSTASMVDKVDPQHHTVVDDEDRIYSAWLKQTRLVSFAGLAQRAAHCELKGYLDLWARVLYEVVPHYPDRLDPKVVARWRRATRPVVREVTDGVGPIMVLTTEDGSMVLGHDDDLDPVPALGVWVYRFDPDDVDRVVDLAEYLEVNRGWKLRATMATSNRNGEIVLPDGMPITRPIDRSASREDEPTGEEDEPACEVAVPIKGVPAVFEGHHCPAYGTPEDPEWIGLYVCEALGIADHHQALDRIPEEERGRCAVPTPGGVQTLKTVKEPGLYRLISESHKPEAERFKNWLFREVLPAIRKTGSYTAPGVAPGGPEWEAMKTYFDEKVAAANAKADRFLDIAKRILELHLLQLADIKQQLAEVRDVETAHVALTQELVDVVKERR